jgi:hypothetical protein
MHVVRTQLTVYLLINYSISFLQLFQLRLFKLFPFLWGPPESGGYFCNQLNYCFGIIWQRLQHPVQCKLDRMAYARYPIPLALFLHCCPHICSIIGSYCRLHALWHASGLHNATQVGSNAVSSVGGGNGMAPLDLLLN